MNKDNDGGQAFPTPYEQTIAHGVLGGNVGMSLRDYFAGQSLAFLAGEPVEVATTAYQIADAMLEAREAEDEASDK